MARVTVEDCVVRVPNRFELVMMAAQRSREVSSGAPLTVDRDNDKNPVVALREIADGTISLEQVRDALIRGRQRHVEMEEPEEEVIELMAGEEDWLRQAAGEAVEGEGRPSGDPFESLDEADLAGFADEDLGLSNGDEQPVIGEPEPAPEEGEAAGAEDSDLPEIGEDIAGELGEEADAADLGGDADETDDPIR